MKNILKIFAITIAVLMIIFAALIGIFSKYKRTTEVCFNQNCFDVEIAKTPQEQERGLMFRDYMEKDKGMLLIFKKEGHYSFWMKNTLIPLDIIWMNQNGEVVFIKENAQPCKETCDPINPQQSAMYVLEVNGGVYYDINLKLGDKIVIH